MRLNLTSSEFADLVACFLFDKVINKDEVVANNDLFNDFIEDMEGRGLKTKLMAYYLNLASSERLNYKRINSVFRDKASSAQEIRISPDDEKKSDTEEIGIVRKSVKLLKKLLKGESISQEEYDMLNEIIKK